MVGVNGQGKAHIGAYSRMADVEVAAICDVDDSVLKQRCGEIEKNTGKRPKEYVDIRKLLEDKTIDAISIATPNHWHSLMGVLACQAGKDVYVEKPCSHSYWEGKQLVAAARKYGRVVQVNTQRRSNPLYVEMRDKYLTSGRLGHIGLVEMYSYLGSEGWSNGPVPDAPVPAHLNYDLWTGPAPLLPYTRAWSVHTRW